MAGSVPEDLIQVMAGLNEIPLSPAYKRLKKRGEDNSVATFNKDDQPSVLKTVEDTGLLVTLVKKTRRERHCGAGIGFTRCDCGEI